MLKRIYARWANALAIILVSLPAFAGGFGINSPPVPFLPGGNGQLSHSGTIAVSGVAQQQANANGARQGICFQNNGFADIWMNPNGTATIATASAGIGSIRFPPGAWFCGPVNWTGAISLISSSSGTAMYFWFIEF